MALSAKLQKMQNVWTDDESFNNWIYQRFSYDAFETQNKFSQMTRLWIVYLKYFWGSRNILTAISEHVPQKS